MASKPNASKMGRPSIYTPELAEKICDLIREGKSERQICKMPGMPDAKTLLRWKDTNSALLDFWGNEGSSCCRPQHRN